MVSVERRRLEQQRADVVGTLVARLIAAAAERAPFAALAADSVCGERTSRGASGALGNARPESARNRRCGLRSRGGQAGSATQRPGNVS